MKRIIGALLLIISLAAMPLGSAQAAPDTGDTVQGPACGDITGDALYTSSIGGVPTVFSSVTTEETSCTYITYSVSVYSTGSSPTLLGQASVRGDGENTFLNLPPVVPSTQPGEVCVTLASSVGGHVVDPAPNGPDGSCSIGTFLLLSDYVGASGMR